MTDKPVEVIQSDRDMAAQHLPKFSPTEPHDVRAGKRDDHWLVQAFARYRLQLTDKADRVRGLIAQLEGLSPDALEVVRLEPDAKRLLALLTNEADREPTAQMGGEDLVEHVAKAIAEADYPLAPGDWDDPECISKTGRENYRISARAAIAALRISARDEVVEECARVADRFAEPDMGDEDEDRFARGYRTASKSIAAAIRVALKAGE